MSAEPIESKPLPPSRRKPARSFLATLSLWCIPLCQPLGVVLGILAILQILRSGGKLSGMRDAVGVLVLNVLLLPVFLVVSDFFFGRGGFFHPHHSGNEASAIGSLKSISVGEEQFKDAACVDQDGDRIGEYGFLSELAGTLPCRISREQFKASPFIPMVLGTLKEMGISQKSGYCFKVYIPGGPGSALSDVEGWTRPGEKGLADLQETSFIVYAWPITAGRYGPRAFVIDSQGQPYAFANSDGRYSGLLQTPSWDDALADTNGDGKVAWNDGIGAEGWVVTG